MLTKRDSGLHEWTCTFSELLIWILETFFPLQQFVRTLSMRSNYFVMFTSPFLNICLWVKTIDYASCHVSFWSLHLGFSNKLSQISHGLVHSTKNSAKKKKGEQKKGKKKKKKGKKKKKRNRNINFFCFLFFVFCFRKYLMANL